MLNLIIKVIAVSLDFPSSKFPMMTVL